MALGSLAGANQTQPNPTHSHQHPRQKLIIQEAIQLTTQRGAVPKGQGTGTVWAGGNQGNSCASQVMTKFILKFSCKNRRRKKIADRSMDPRHCRSEVCRGKKKNHCTVFFFFASQTSRPFFPQSILQEFLFPKKDKDISADNSVGSSSLSHQQN